MPQQKCEIVTPAQSLHYLAILLDSAAAAVVLSEQPAITPEEIKSAAQRATTVSLPAVTPVVGYTRRQIQSVIDRGGSSGRRLLAAAAAIGTLDGAGAKGMALAARGAAESLRRVAALLAGPEDKVAEPTSTLSVAISSERAEAVASTTQKRACYERDHVWHEWYRQEQMKPVGIRDRWNEENPRRKVTLETVRNGLKVAKREAAASKTHGAKRKPTPAKK